MQLTMQTSHAEGHCHPLQIRPAGDSQKRTRIDILPRRCRKSGLGFRHAGLSRGKRLPRGIRALHGGLESLVLGGRL